MRSKNLTRVQTCLNCHEFSYFPFQCSLAFWPNFFQQEPLLMSGAKLPLLPQCPFSRTPCITMSLNASTSVYQILTALLDNAEASLAQSGRCIYCSAQTKHRKWLESRWKSINLLRNVQLDRAMVQLEGGVHSKGAPSELSQCKVPLLMLNQPTKWTKSTALALIWDRSWG